MALQFSTGVWALVAFCEALQFFLGVFAAPTLGGPWCVVGGCLVFLLGAVFLCCLLGVLPVTTW